MLISYRPTAASSDVLDEALLARVYDEHFRELSDLRVERVVHTLGGEPNRAEFAVPLDSYHRWKDGASVVHEGELHADRAVPPGELSVGIDDVVHVGIPLGGDRVLVIFRGRITDVDVVLTDGGEAARLTALGPRHAMDNTDLRGARYRDASGAGVVDTDLPLVFNPENLGNYDPVGSAAEGEPLFGDPVEPDTDDPHPWGHYWTLAGFWKYIVTRYAPALDARVQTLNLRLLGDDEDAVLPPTSVDGMRPARALTHVLSAYGLDWWIDPVCVVNRWSVWEDARPVFRVVSPAASAAKTVRLQAPGETFSKSLTNVSSGAMHFTTRGCVNQWRIEGDFAEYEACFELVKLWTTSEESQVSADPDLGSRAHEDYDVALDHVYRQWGLNEDGGYADRDVFDFDALLGEGTWTRGRRRLLPPYQETDDEPKKCIIEIKASTLDAEWHAVGSGIVRLLSDRAGVYFDMSDVDGTDARLLVDDGSLVALKDLTAVRITAIVQSDERVSFLASRQDTSGSTQTITNTRRDRTFRRVTRHASSTYADEGTGVLRDDADEAGPMEKLADRLRKTRQPLMNAVSMTLPWPEFRYRLGERLTEVGGREIALGTGAEDEPAWPVVERITHDFTVQRTGLGLRVRGPGR
ncbi:MAG TPA: hypothetical protein VMY39_10730 [Planctomycetota bacterium]|nr:hypothetical protein [Planctomycetota bacterium]